MLFLLAMLLAIPISGLSLLLYLGYVAFTIQLDGVRYEGSLDRERGKQWLAPVRSTHRLGRSRSA